ncbi:MAG: putative selenate ABC transporter substrate-binding protein [Acidimicrobiales bacterium]
MRHSRLVRFLLILSVFGLVVAACGSDDDSDGASDETSGDETSADEASADEGGTDGSADGDDQAAAGGFEGTLVIGAIPDQDPEILVRNYDLLADYLATELGVDVEFRPVTEYDAAVTAFKVGDLQLVWFGGLTGVQARLEVDGAEAIAQRDIDEQFTSVFIAGTDTGVEPFDDVSGLSAVAGHSLTFGSESSTSGRLMPQSFLADAGVTLDDLEGEPGFSGSHDSTIALVEAGTYEVGALNSQVWEARVEEGAVDTDKVQVVWETTEYYDYHWVARPELADIEQAIIDALVGLDPADPDQAEILAFFGAETFIVTESGNYAQIEAVGRESGLITE